MRYLSLHSWNVSNPFDLQRKCWWDGIEVELKQAGEDTPRSIKLWARRVWTLELSLVRSFISYN